MARVCGIQRYGEGEYCGLALGAKGVVGHSSYRCQQRPIHPESVAAVDYRQAEGQQFLGPTLGRGEDEESVGSAAL